MLTCPMITTIPSTLRGHSLGGMSYLGTSFISVIFVFLYLYCDPMMNSAIADIALQIIFVKS